MLIVELKPKIDYLGKYDLGTIKNTIKLGVAVDFNSVPIIKLGEEIVEEIYKIKDQKPIVFGEKYNKKSSHKLELIS